MTALIRYTTATMLHSQRYLAPVLLFIAAVGILSRDDNGPLPPVHSTCAGALFMSAVWLTMALTSVDDPAHRAITIITAGSARRVLLATVAVAALSCLVLTAFGVTAPLILGTHTVTGPDIIVAVEAHLACAATGIAIGLLCSRTVIPRPGYALVAAIVLVLITLFIRSLPSVNALLRLMGKANDSTALLLPVSGYLAVGVAILTAATIATHHITTRRD